MLAVAAAGVAIAALAAGTTGAAKRGSQLVPRTPEAVISAAVSGFRDLRIVDATIGAPPRGFRKRGRTAWLFYKVRAATSPQLVRGYWQADIVTGLVRDVSARRRWPIPAGDSFTRVLPNGREIYDSSSVAGPLFKGEIDAMSEEEVAAAVRASTAANGLVLRAIRYSRPLGRLAVEIRVEVNVTPDFVRRRRQILSAVVDGLTGTGGRPRVEGTLVEAVDAKGRILSIQGYAGRITSGVNWIDPRIG